MRILQLSCGFMDLNMTKVRRTLVQSQAQRLKEGTSFPVLMYAPTKYNVFFLFIMFQGFINVRVWFPKLPGVVMMSDQEVIIMCKPPERVVTQNKAAGFAGAL